MCDYADAYFLLTGDINAVGGDADTKAAFKNCHPFVKAEIHLNDDHVESANNLGLQMNMYNLIEYSDNFYSTTSDSTASLYQFKIQEQNYIDNRNNKNRNLTVDDSSSFRYRCDLLENSTEVAAGANPNIPLAHRLWKNAQIIFP